jgi:ATP-dependent DNA ligase
MWPSNCWVEGADLRSLRLRKRRQRLQAVLPEASAIVSEALSVTGRAKRLADRYEHAGAMAQDQEP